MASGRVAAGVDLGGTKIYTAIADAGGRVLGDDKRSTEADLGPARVVARIVDSLGAALANAGVEAGGLAGVGISSPGPIDTVRGIVTDAPNLPGWHDVHLARLVSEATGLATLLENDANAAAFGEYVFGAGRGFRHIVYVTCGTGIGGGIIIDGRVYGGASGGAGEVGHMTVLDGGPACNCGGSGCVEALASGTAIEAEAAAAIERGRSPALKRLVRDGDVTGEAVHQAALEGDDVAREIIHRAGYFLGVGLAGLLNVFNPQALIVGGGLLAMSDLYLGPAWKAARERAFRQAVEDATLRTAALGGQAGALGAAALVMEGTNPVSSR